MTRVAEQEIIDAFKASFADAYHSVIDRVTSTTGGGLDDLVRLGLARDRRINRKLFAELLPVFVYKPADKETAADKPVHKLPADPEDGQYDPHNRRLIDKFTENVFALTNYKAAAPYLLHAVATREISRVKEAGRIILGHRASDYTGSAQDYALAMMKIDAIEQMHTGTHPLITWDLVEQYPGLNAEAMLTRIARPGAGQPGAVAGLVRAFSSEEVIGAQEGVSPEKFAAYAAKVEPQYGSE